ncbi:Ig-like domain-containing protein [Paenibacillus sp. YPG26]|uniref:Ig-like domain-containing protein n=1 Tax=Paenibacillus sp. YPG26 TaxID=2878915 RepID=UPI002041E0CD|nr:Ig-like domain-containing protein [Paenibacillus sp. YPG26]USB31924.1 Ig-like domain-containing protein [Paenibacillus sp. YPG26]
MLRSIIRVTRYTLVGLAFASGIFASQTHAAAESRQPVIEWSHQYAKDQQFSDASSIVPTSDGGYITAGRQDNGDDNQAYVMKLDSNGKVQWEQKIQLESSKYTEALKAAETRNGEFVVSGTTDKGPYDVIFLAKLGTQGTVQWQKEYDHGIHENGNAVSETKDGGFVVTGYTNSDSGGTPAFVLKTDAKGQEVWHNTYPFGSNQYFNDIIATPDGGSVAVGTIDRRNDSRDILGAVVVKLNASGKKVWSRTLITKDSGRSASSVIPSGDGGYVVASRSWTGINYLTKIGADGKVSWEKTYSAAPDRELLKQVVKIDQGYALLGEYLKRDNSDHYKHYELLKVDAQGEAVDRIIFSSKNYEVFSAGTTSPDGGFIVSGQAKTNNKYILQLTKLAGQDHPVDPTVTEIYYTDSSKQITVGESTSATVNARYSNGTEARVTDSLTFTSEDENIAAVDSNGLITGINPGNTMIEAVYQGYSTQLNVQVSKAPDSGGSGEWSYQYGKDQLSTNGSSIAPSSDGGYIITGDTRDQDGDTKAYILKANSSGGIQWQQKLQHGEYSQAKKAVQTKDGGFIISGSFSSQDGRPHNAIFLAKLSAQGIVEWDREFDNGSNVNGDSVAETEDGGFVVTGYTLSASGEDSAYVLKTDAQGQQLWFKWFRFGSNQHYNDIIATPDGGAIAVGTLDTIIGGTEDDGALVTKLNNAGEEVWTKKFVHANSGRNGYSIISSEDGGYVIASNAGNDGDSINYLTKIDNSGEVIWEKNYDPTSDLDIYTTLSRTEQGYALIGNTRKGEYPDYESQFEVLQVDNNGEMVNNTVLPGMNLYGSGRGTAAADGGFVLMGTVPVNEKYLLQLIKLPRQNQTPVEGSFYLDSDEYSITAGDTIDTIALLRDKDGMIHNVTKNAIFKSENPQVVQYDAEGNITGLKAGITTITAEYQGQTYRAQVQVVRASVPKS